MPGAGYGLSGLGATGSANFQLHPPGGKDSNAFPKRVRESGVSASAVRRAGAAGYEVLEYDPDALETGEWKKATSSNVVE
jgi:hypothetical protein